MNEISVMVPNGWWVGAARSHEVGLRALTGSDELFLVEMGFSLHPPARTTALLARCVTALDIPDQTARGVLLAMTAGDRDALVLQLIRLSLGERLSAVVTCPRSECAALLDLDLAVADLLLPPYSDPLPWYERTLSEDGAAYRVRFRLVQGADLEAVAPVAATNLDAAAELLLRRCVDRVAPEGDANASLDSIPDAVRRQLPAVLGDLDPQAELVLKLVCPECGAPFRSLLDPTAYLCHDVDDRASSLLQEIHVLAACYHWSQAAILAMPRARRRAYAERVAEMWSEVRPA